MLKCCELRCEYEKEPMGIDVEVPRFSWKLESSDQNVLQTAYEVVVDGMWESGKVESDRSIHVEYAGKKLSPCTCYTYRVRVWDNYGGCSDWEESAFETGLMDSVNWKANWIGLSEEMLSVCPVFRKEFKIRGKVASARIYASSYGLYEIFLNGLRVGDRYLTPGFTQYEKRVQYQIYDVTGLLKDGKNAVGVPVGKGWCRGRYPADGNNIYKRKASLLFQMRVVYEDGTQDIIISDESWKCGESAVLSSEIYDGEIYDARKEQPFSVVGFDDSGWKNACLLKEYDVREVVAQESEPVRIVDTIAPVSLIRTPKNQLVIDFGQNLVGWVEFKVKGKAGDLVLLRHGEVLDKEGNFYNANLRSARQKVEYTLKGGEEESYSPHFTFFGFRYVFIEKFPGEPALEQFTARVICTDMERIGHFTCSDPLVNQLYHNVIWGQLGNFVDIPTDCPQRDERAGWTGDAQVFAATAAKNMNVAKFFTKWLHDMTLSQREDGAVGVIVPRLHFLNTSSAWGDAATICPWAMYEAYGDSRLLEEQYGCMKGWVEYIRSQGDNEYLWNTGNQLGDWLALDKETSGNYTGATPTDLIATAFYAHSCDLVARAAGALGMVEAAEKYSRLHARVVEEFQKEFITPSGRLVCDTQTGYVLALHFHLTPMRERAVEELVRLIREKGNHLTTGFVGTPYLCKTLSDNGYGELAYELLLQKTYPSWLYSVTKGATTIWEHWDGIREDGTFWSKDMNSFNHYAYGSIADWLYETAAGIGQKEPGYRRILIAPMPDKRLTHLSASIDTMYGEIASSWKEEGGKYVYHIRIPCNTQAEIRLPSGRVEHVGSGSYECVE